MVPVFATHGFCLILNGHNYEVQESLFVKADQQHAGVAEIGIAPEHPTLKTAERNARMLLVGEETPQGHRQSYPCLGGNQTTLRGN
jgi:hypothetical protein